MTNVYDGNRLKRMHTHSSKYYRFVGTNFPLMSGDYVHISAAATCLAVQDLTAKVDTLSKKVEVLTVSNATLQENVRDLEYLQVVTRFNNILANCISSAYLDILKRVHEATKENIYSWGELMDRAELDPYLQEHIHTAFVAAGFTKAEWVALYTFKLNHNDNNHIKFRVSEVYEIVTQIADTPDINNLWTGLNKAIAIHKTRGGNWMDRYPWYGFDDKDI